MFGIGKMTKGESDTFALRRRTGDEVKVTECRFTLVAIDDRGRPRPVPAAG